MSEKDPIRIFVTHEFSESQEYARVFEYLESRDNFFYKNTSLPGDEPEGSQEGIQESLRNQIKAAEILIYPVGCMSDSSPLLRFQLTVAEAFKTPILAIKSFGGTINITKALLDSVDDMVDWNDRIITDAVKKLARGDDGTGWDVIEFDMD